MKLTRLADVARSVGSVSRTGTECGSPYFLRGYAFLINELLFRNGSDVAQSRGK